jgi:hypothetical protein
MHLDPSAYADGTDLISGHYLPRCCLSVVKRRHTSIQLHFINSFGDLANLRPGL